MALSGALWCEEHHRWECSAKPRKPGGHHAAAIRGTRYCKNCSGRPIAAAKAIGEANLLAWSTQLAGDAPMLDPARVVMDQLRVAVLRADLLGELVRLQMVEDPLGGLIGLTRTAGREGTAVESGEQVRALPKIEGEWRDRAVRFAKTAHDMGIAEREIEMAQADAQRVINAFVETVRVLELDGPRRDLAVRTFLAGLDQELGAEPVVVAGEVTT